MSGRYAGWMATGGAAVLVALAPAGAVARPVPVRAAEHADPGQPEFGRMVFDWPVPATGSASIADGRLSIRFSQPIEAPLTQIVDRLPKWLSGGEIAADRLTVSFTLRIPATVREMQVGNALVYDLAPAPAAPASAAAAKPPPAAPPAAGSVPAPAAAAPATVAPATVVPATVVPATAPPPVTPPRPAPAPAAEAPVVRVRGGESGRTSRLVFDWTRPVKTALVRDGRSVRINFDQPARFDFGALAKVPPANVARLDQVPAATAVASLVVPADAVIKESRSGDRTVFDITSAAGMGPLPPVVAEAPKPPPVAVAAAPAAVAPAAAPPPVTAPPAAPPSAAAVPPADLPSVPVPPGVAGGDPALATAAAVAAGSGPTITFDAQMPAAAAVFARGETLYAVFDRALPVTAGVVSGNAAGLIGPIEPVAATGGSAFRMAMRPWLRPVVERSGTAWKVVFVPKSQPQRTELPVEAQADFALGGRLVIGATDASSLVELTDPEVGERLMVVPLPVAVQAVSDVNRFPEVEFLPALQGIVIRPLGDGVLLRPVREGLEVTAAGGLHLSPGVDIALARGGGGGGAATPDALMTALGRPVGPGGETSARPAAASDHRLFDLKSWKRTDSAKFTDERQKLQQVVVDAPPTEKIRARLALARFYFANGFNQEAQGLMEVVAQEQPDVLGWAEFKALRGASRIAAGSAREGLGDLAGPGLDDNREAALWRAAARVMMRTDLPAAARDFYLADDILDSYPNPYFGRLSLMSADARIQNGDPREAERVLKRYVRRVGGGVEKTAPAQYLKGEILHSLGKVDEAIGQLREAADGADRMYRTRAGLALINLELAENRISPAAAADRLSRLRFSWRGDDLELDIIQRHGEALWAAGNYSEGLNTLREAAGYFPDSPRAGFITENMTRLFADLFKDGASKLSPLKAIEVYDQFRELTPVGVAGDHVVRALAERLVEVDLLGRAAELLQHQVDFRLTGLEKAQVGTRLATIRLLDGQPDQAIKALASSKVEDIPQVMAAERRLLQARALSQLQRGDDATTLLAGDDSRAANMLRVDIAWHDQKWDEAAKALEKVIGPPPASGKPLEKTTGQLVLNRAIALALAGDSAALATLRRQFGSAMANSSEADAFRVLTRPDQVAGGIDLASIKARVAEVDVFQNFLKDFRSSLPGARPPG
jgi:tetratricopeptide (TPR) repeat protein